MKRINIPPKFLYFTIIFLFAAIILFFSAIYPLGMDELRLSSASLAETFLQVKIEVTKDSPRFMSIFHVLLLRSPSLCKLVFTILNPFAQIFILLGLFFVITLKDAFNRSRWRNLQRRCWKQITRFKETATWK